MRIIFGVMKKGYLWYINVGKSCRLFELCELWFFKVIRVKFEGNFIVKY